MKRIALLASLLLLAGGYLYLFSYPAPPVDPEWAIEPGAPAAPGDITVRFSGTSTLLFSDGETAWMVDGWFSRPGPWQLLTGGVEPDVDAIAWGLERNGVDRLAAVIPAHSHYDHAMDAPEVARRTGAVVIGSEATANIARGWGLDEAQIRVVADRETVRLGAFEVTFIESRHFQFPDPAMVETMLTQNAIPEPLVPPVGVTDYKLGKAYVLHVRHPALDFMVIGSAGFVPGQLDDVAADVLFLGVGGLGSQSAAYREDFWRYTVDAVDPARVILVHWDSLIGPLDGPMTGEIRIAGFLSRGADQTLAFLRGRAAADPERLLQTLPRFEPVALSVEGVSEPQR